MSVGYDSLYGAYLKSHYPLEYYSVALNNYLGDEERTSRLTKELEHFDIKIESPKFRLSKAEYFPNRETNTIYKGVGSIKFLNNQVADELYELRDNKYNNFVELLKDIYGKTSINSRQLEILIKLDYFSEFGKSQKLLKVVELYDKIASKKQFTKGKLPCGLSEDMMRKYSNKETEKLFKEVDVDRLVSDLCMRIPDKDIPIQAKLQSELDYLGYCSTIIPFLSSHAFVLNVDTKYTPKITVYRIGTGETITDKISKKIYKGLTEGEVIAIFTTENKMGDKKVGETFDKKTGKMKPIFEKDPDKIVPWITSYDTVGGWLNMMNNKIK